MQTACPGLLANAGASLLLDAHESYTLCAGESHKVARSGNCLKPPCFKQCLRPVWFLAFAGTSELRSLEIVHCSGDCSSTYQADG